MAHITHLSLMLKKNADQSYSLHPLVQWWALRRLLKQFLNMLFRSLKHIQQNDIAKLLKVRHE